MSQIMFLGSASSNQVMGDPREQLHFQLLMWKQVYGVRKMVGGGVNQGIEGLMCDSPFDKAGSNCTTSITQALK